MIATQPAHAKVRAAIVGFGWMGQAHARSLLRAPTLFHDSPYRVTLTAVADTDPDRRRLAVDAFGAERALADWRELIEAGGIDAVWVAAPNMLHVDVIEAAAAAGLAIFCEKPVGGTPEQTAMAHAAAASAGVSTGVGYNYRWAPLVQHAKHLLDSGIIGDVVHYRGTFFSMYGSDRLSRLSWRFRVAEGGHGVSSDLLSHSVDLAHFLVGPIASVVSTTATFVPERPLPTSGGTHYDRGSTDDPTGQVTNEDTSAFSPGSAVVRGRRSNRAGHSSGPRVSMLSPSTALAERSAGTLRP